MKLLLKGVIFGVFSFRGTCGLGSVTLTLAHQRGGHEFKPGHRRGAYHHSVPNYGGGSNDLVVK
jgi:hypothetical protein